MSQAVCDSSHKYTQQGVKLLSSATTEKSVEAGVSRTFYEISVKRQAAGPRAGSSLTLEGCDEVTVTEPECPPTHVGRIMTRVGRLVTLSLRRVAPGLRPGPD